MEKKTNYTAPEIKEIMVHTAGVIAASPTGRFEGIGSGDSQNVDDFKW